MSRFLLDTQVIYLASVDGRLPAKVKALLLDPENERLVSATSVLEIAIKNEKGSIALTRDGLSAMAADLRLTIIPFTPSHAMRLFDLPIRHSDPFDRMLIATALVENLPLVGGDSSFPLYKPEGLQVIWR